MWFKPDRLLIGLGPFLVFGLGGRRQGSGELTGFFLCFVMNRLEKEPIVVMREDSSRGLSKFEKKKRTK